MQYKPQSKCWVPIHPTFGRSRRCSGRPKLMARGSPRSGRLCGRYSHRPSVSRTARKRQMKPATCRGATAAATSFSSRLVSDLFHHDGRITAALYCTLATCQRLGLPLASLSHQPVGRRKSLTARQMSHSGEEWRFCSLAPSLRSVPRLRSQLVAVNARPLIG